MVPERIAPMRNYNKNDNTRKCKKCCEWKDLSEFSSRVRIPSPTTKDIGKKIPTLYYRSECKECSLLSIRQDKYMGKEAKKEQHRKDPRKVMLMHARSRSKSYEVPFNIEVSDIVIPKICPLLEIPIKVSSGGPSGSSPSLDRIIPSKGYTKGNVIVISLKANTAKSNLSIQELELLVRNLKRVLNKEEELLES